MQKNTKTSHIVVVGLKTRLFIVYTQELPVNTVMEENAMFLLDNTEDATFVCDSLTSEIIYINSAACKLFGKDKKECMGKRCYEMFWNRCNNCDRCEIIEKCKESFYHEDTVLLDGKTSIHIKAKLANWGGRKVKIHYLQKR